MKDWIEKTLKDFSFCKWDRYIPKYPFICFYGWMDRDKNNYKDFLVLVLDIRKRKPFFSVTSSLKYHKKISKILNIEHMDCKRVETYFNLENVIRLSVQNSEKNNTNQIKQPIQESFK